MERRQHCERTPHKVKFLSEADAEQGVRRHWRIAMRLQSSLTGKDRRSRPYECTYEDGCGYWHVTTSFPNQTDPTRRTPLRGVEFDPEPEPDAPDEPEEAAVSSIVANVVKETVDGDPVQIKVVRRFRVSNHLRQEPIGSATYTGHDGLGEHYAVFADGHQVGVIERQGERVTPFPDYEGTYEALFTALLRVL